MHTTIIDIDSIPRSERANYGRHHAGEVTEQFAGDLEPILIAHADGEPLTSDQVTHGWWVGRIDPLDDYVAQLVGMPPNGQLSRYLSSIGGVSVWTHATWRAVAGLVVSVTWRAQQLEVTSFALWHEHDIAEKPLRRRVGLCPALPPTIVFTKQAARGGSAILCNSTALPVISASAPPT